VKFFVAATIPPAVQILACGDGGVSICLTTETLEEAELLAADLAVAVKQARDMRARATTRPMCTRCQRDCSACTCSSARKGGAA
jgi:hypothetical protein